MSSVLPDIEHVEHSMNGDVDTRCTHWLCSDCWDEIAKHDRRCPICRYDLDAWFRMYEEAETEGAESEEDMEPDLEAVLREEIRVLRAEAVDRQAFLESTRLVLGFMTRAKAKARAKARRV